MRLRVMNQVEAEDYAFDALGGSMEDYSFSAVVDARAQDPETAYEAVNRSAFLQIEGMGDIGEGFGEHQYELDVVKSGYAGELEDLTDADEVLRENGLEYATDISIRRQGDTPEEAISQLDGADVTPVLVGTDQNYSETIFYNPGEMPVFQPRVQPTSSSTPEEAVQREEELERILRALNVE